MTTPSDLLPKPVLQALQRGSLLDAIKLLAENKGAGFRQARQALQAHLREQAGAPRGNVPTSAPARGRPTASAPPRQPAPADDKMEAIRRMREQTGLGLKEAQHVVESLRGNPVSGLDGRSPGEVPRTEGTLWWVVGCAIAAIAGYYLLP